MVRTPSVDKNGLKKGAWSEEEDNKLRAYIQRYGHWNWRQLPKFAGLNRCGKSCRLRWMNYLKPGVRRGNFSIHEENLILKLLEEFGHRWSAIAAKLPGRTDNDIKNYWHTRLRKHIKKDIEPTKIMEQTSERSQHMDDADQNEQSSIISAFDSTQNRELMEPHNAAAADACSEVSSLSCDSKLFDALDWVADHEDAISSVDQSFTQTFGSFWTEPFALDTSYNNNIHWLPPFEEEFMYPFSSFLDDDLDWFQKFNQ